MAVWWAVVGIGQTRTTQNIRQGGKKNNFNFLNTVYSIKVKTMIPRYTWFTTHNPNIAKNPKVTPQPACSTTLHPPLNFKTTLTSLRKTDKNKFFKLSRNVLTHQLLHRCLRCLLLRVWVLERHRRWSRQNLCGRSFRHPSQVRLEYHLKQIILIF